MLHQVLGQEVQDRARLLGRHALDADRVGGVQVEGFLAGHGMGAHHRMEAALDLADQVVGQLVRAAGLREIGHRPLALHGIVLHRDHHVADGEVHLQRRDHLAIGVAQRPIGQGGIAPDGVAAIGRDLDRTQHGDRRRLGQERRVGVPAFPEDVFGAVVGLLDEGMDVAMVRHARGVGVLGEGAEAEAEALVLAVAQLLVPQVDHLVPEQGRAHLFELLVRHARDVDAGDLRAHGGRQGLHLDEVAGLGGVVELVGGMQPHGDVLV